MKRFFCGLLAAVAIAVSAAAGAALLGLVPVAADDPPGASEERIARFVLRRSIARRAPEHLPGSTSKDDFAAGREIYEEMCARCHGGADGKPSPLASAFHPAAPELSAHATHWSDGELFWIIEHGIRNTGMPAWGGILSAGDIRHVVAFVQRMHRS